MFLVGVTVNDTLVYAVYKHATRIYQSTKSIIHMYMLIILVGDITDYKEWSKNFNERVESFMSDSSRFVKFEDRKNESNLTLENYKGISKGKMGNI